MDNFTSQDALNGENSVRALSNDTSQNEPEIILDFFAGNGTTAHAVMELNSQDKGNRHFILVQLDEKIDEKNQKVALLFGDKFRYAKL